VKTVISSEILPAPVAFPLTAVAVIGYWGAGSQRLEDKREHRDNDAGEYHDSRGILKKTDFPISLTSLPTPLPYKKSNQA
jgi:hypothetical protein